MNNTYLPVDTIKAGIYLPYADIDLYGYRHRKSNHYQLYKLLEVDSSTKITLNYNIQHQYFSLKVSLPKLLCGTNAINLPAACAGELITLVNEYLLTEGLAVNFADFKVSLLELSFNYECNNVEDKNYIIKHCSNKDISRKDKTTFDTSVVFKNKTSWTTLYDKTAEMEATQALPANNHSFDKTLRLEHKLLKKAVKRHFKANTVADILFSDRLEEVFLKENQKAGLSLKPLHKKVFFKVLENQLKGKSHSFQNRVFSFYKELNTLGEMYVQEHYSKFQISKYKKIMQSAGYSTTYICQSAHPVDFMSLKNKENKRLTQKEIREMLGHIKLGKKKSFIVEVKEFLSHCLPCKFFKKVIKFFAKTD